MGLIILAALVSVAYGICIPFGPHGGSAVRSFFGGCASQKYENQPQCFTAPTVTQAVVKFKTTGSYSDNTTATPIAYTIKGVVSLQQINRYESHIVGTIAGAEAFLPNHDKMAVHVHMFGEINSNCQSTGTHFNPCNKSHSDDPSAVNRHVGDIGMFNITAGITKFEFLDTQVKLSGLLSVLGRAITVHAGKSQARVACGTIAVTSWPDTSAPHPDTVYNATNPFWAN